MTKHELVETGYRIFSEFEKPSLLQESRDLDPEGRAHEALLKSRKRNTLQLDDVAGIGYNPITCITPEGMAYFMPRLLELALDIESNSKSEAEPYLWGFILQIMPNSNEDRFRRFRSEHYCHVCSVLRFIEDNFISYIKEQLMENEFEITLKAWCAKCAQQST
ncbi:MAG: hypothetical protein KDI68_11640 [Gammaproteobacteria bacterium]|nr:hypothetical protein [Gammaproteobacteria bacterium]